MNAVYEVIDASDEDRYYPLGVFPNYKSALDHIEDIERKKEKISEYAEEHEEIRIIEREFGWSENGRCVLIIKREEYYDEEKDEYFWRRV